MSSIVYEPLKLMRKDGKMVDAVYYNNADIENVEILNSYLCINYPYNSKAINYISKKLYSIRRFRNRIFHYEKIFKYPTRTLHLYNDILEMLSYLPNDDLDILKRTSIFLNTYNSLMKLKK